MTRRGSSRAAPVRLRVGRAQIERLRRARSSGLAAAPSQATQAMSGAGCASTMHRRRRIRRPAIGENLRGIADQMRRAEPRRRERLRDRRDARRHQRAAVAADHLQIDVIVPRIDRRRSPGARRSRRPRGAAKAASVVSPTTGLPAASAMPRAAEMPTRKPVKLPGPVVTAMRSSAAKAMPDCLHDARDQRHQRFGMAALHRLRFLRDQLAGVGVEHGGGAGIERGIDGEDQHGRVWRMQRVRRISE